MSLEKSLEKLEKHAEEALEGIVKKDNITAAEMEMAEKAVCILNTIKQIKNADMMVDTGYSGRAYAQMPYMHEMSYMRGRDPATGRYMSRDVDPATNVSNWSYDPAAMQGRAYGNRYSGHSKRDGMIETLNEMLDKAQTESEKEYIRKWLRRVDNY